MDSWLAFWNAPNKIYVNDRHQQAHYDKIFSGVRPFLPSSRDSVVLDWGCGDALAAERMAACSGTVLLYDGAEAISDRLRRRHAGNSSLKVLDDAGLASLAPESLDLIVVNSVVQYLSQAQLAAVVTEFHRWLKPDGAFLLGDVIEPDTPMLRDMRNLLRFAWRDGFFVPAVMGLIVTFLSPYRKLRHQLGFSCYTPFQISQLLEAHGFSTTMLADNVAPSRHRRSFLAKKRVR